MAEFDEKLNSILSNPDAMSQIMQLAQSLGGGGTSGSPPQQGQPPPAWGSPQQQGPQQQGPQQQDSPPLGALSSLAGGLDPGLIARLLPLIQELGGQRDSNARNLLYALRPYLRSDRQEKVERALQLARLFHLGKKFLSGWEG